MEKATQRILKALSHPKAKILGHPTGRILLYRQGLKYDWEQLFEFCRSHHKILEINASPDRLDLPDILIKEALNHQVQLVINTDSHSAKNMTSMKYGVWAARRGWAETKGIVNTLPWEEMQRILDR